MKYDIHLNDRFNMDTNVGHRCNSFCHVISPHEWNIGRTGEIFVGVIDTVASWSINYNIMLQWTLHPTALWYVATHISLQCIML